MQSVTFVDIQISNYGSVIQGTYSGIWMWVIAETITVSQKEKKKKNPNNEMCK